MRAYQTIQASPTHTPRGWHIFEEEIHGGQSYEHLEGRGTLYTSGSRRKLPYGHGGLDRSGASPYFWSYLMSTSPDKDWPESECDNPGGSTDWDRWRPVRNQLED